MAFEDLPADVTDQKTDIYAIREAISANGISDRQQRNLPHDIRRKLPANAWSLIPNKQSHHFRYQHNALFWIKDKKHWQQVSFSQYSHHTGERYAFVPHKAIGTKEVLKYAGSGQKALNTQNLPHQSRENKSGLNQAQINHLMLGSGDINGESALEPTVFISKPDNGAQIELTSSAHVHMRFSQHTFINGDTLDSVTKQYTGKANPDLIYQYNYNEGIRRSSPPQTGDSVRVPSGWDSKVEGSVTNANSVELKWQGSTSGSTLIDIPKPSPNKHSAWETRVYP